MNSNNSKIRCIFVLTIILIAVSVSYGDPIFDSSQDEDICALLMGRIMGDESRGVILPLKKTDVRMEITSGIVKAEVTQVYTNDTEYPLEAVYVFPLPSDATISDMELRIENRIIKSIVQERKEAKRTYEKAKKEGKKTALLEEERPNIFTTSVANFLPGETVKIKFSYFLPAEYKKGEVSTAFPMVIGQRFVPFRIRENDDGTVEFTSPVKDQKHINPPLLPSPNIDPEHRLSIKVEVNGIPVEDIESSTHKIIWSEDFAADNKYFVTLKEEVTVPDCDFDLRIKVNEEDEPELTCVTSQWENENYGIVTVFPPCKEKKSTQQPDRSREVVFLIDTSGSMSGTSIDQAKAGLIKCLKMLKPQDTFTIVRFANDYTYFSKQPVPATNRNLDSAKEYINSIKSGGGTMMQPALKYVLDLLKANVAKRKSSVFAGGTEEYGENPGRVQMVIFLTDGCVGNEDSLFKLLSTSLGSARLFTFGIGSAPNSHLMQEMARIGRGQSRYIRSHEDVGRIMSDFFKTLEAPVLTDVELTFIDQFGNEIQDVKYFPNPCPDVFYERPLQVITKFPGAVGGKVVVKGFYDNSYVIYEYPLKNIENKSYTAINKMFAESKVDELNHEYAIADGFHRKEEIKEEIIEIGLKYQLVTKFTSRVAVEEKIEKKPNGELVTVKVPTKLPRGWSENYWYGTATNDYRDFVIGLFLIFTGFAIWSNYKRRRKIEK